MISLLDERIEYQFDAEKVWIEPWGRNAVRIRATKVAKMPEENWALNPAVASPAQIRFVDGAAELVNGKIKARIEKNGKITIFNQKGEKLLEERWRNRRNLLDPKCSALEVEGRQFRPIPGGDYHLTMRLENIDPNERIYGMGQYQQTNLNLKGTDLELAQRNSQASVPFAVSSLGYGLLWNNPGVGRVVFGANLTSYEVYSTQILDYWIVAGDTPGEIVEAYADVTGKVPMIPEHGIGFWQSKCRYQTQEELLEVAREYKRRNLPIDVIVCDYWHWKKQGEWTFDHTYWPDPKGMVDELKSMGIELMISVWPTVDKTSENYYEMLEKGYLIRTDRGARVGLDFQSATIHFDATNPLAQRYIWEKAKKSYYNIGIRTFWLDESEPEYTAYDFDNYRYHTGSNMQVGNRYPVEFAKAFYDGLTAEGHQNVLNYTRCAWAGIQKYGVVIWSGDIASSFESLREQLPIGLNMGMAGIPWWSCDIGGFHGGAPASEEYRELFVRWFQFGTFCPMMRLHGEREPRSAQLGIQEGMGCTAGAPNEIWSYGETVYEICKKYLLIRESLRGYIRDKMREAHEKGTPVMRTLFYEFPEDAACWQVEDEYLFGDRYLIAPVLHRGQDTRMVYLPSGANWKKMGDASVLSGGTRIEVACPLSEIPVFERVDLT